ncbi:MAG: PfkB family carbohydrate kinase [Planctomycetota bacterium]|jgi:rfaE bifunctional protein kinase chain/domain|nr:PfkB family carbohydrate kinase [Planctomycetota bacterium]
METVDAFSELTQLSELRSKNRGRRLALVTGQFNVVHPGHIRLLAFARSLADHLVVAVLPGNSVEYLPQELRLTAVRSLEMVDYGFSVSNDFEACVQALKPDVIVKGAEFSTRDNPEAKWLREWGGRVVFCTDDPRFSYDAMLRGLLENRQTTGRLDLPAAYLERHSIKRKDYSELLEKMSRLRVMVVGDLIIDEYVMCLPLGMSREDPTLVVSPLEERRFVGGAGIVAGHAASLGGQVRLITLVGNDPAAEFAAKWFSEQKIDAQVAVDRDRPTTVKRRYKAQNQTLLRVNRLSQQQIDSEKQEHVFKLVANLLPETDLLIFSDFSYGILTPELASRVSNECRRLDVPIVADSQTSSQIGDLTKFRHALLVTPTELEARQAMRDFNQGLVALADELRTSLAAENVIITLSENGCLIHCDHEKYPIFTDNLPSLNPQPLDVAGAGDSFLAASALALAAGADIWRAALLGSVAAGLQVGRIGNERLETDNIRQGLGI